MMDDLRSLAAPSLRPIVRAEGTFEAKGSTSLSGGLISGLLLLLGIWAITSGDRATWAFVALFALGVGPTAVVLLSSRSALIVDRSRIKYERRSLWKTDVVTAPRDALVGVRLKRRVYEGESRFIVHFVEAQFAHPRLPAFVKIGESLNEAKMRAKAEELSRTLAVPLTEEIA